MNRIRWWLYFLLVFGSLIPVGTYYIITSWFKKDSAYLFKKVSNFMNFAFRIFSIHIKVENKDYLKSEKGYLFVSNHQSFLDIPIIMGFISFTGFFAKKELSRIPLFTYFMNRYNCICVDRKKPRSFAKFGITMKQKIEQGVRYCVFPEGTRSKTTALLPFKVGILKLAHKYDISIIPITLNTHYILPKGKQYLNKGTISAFIHKPINNPKELSLNELSDKIKSDIASKLKE